jgi:hypothetical protein
VQQQTQNLNGLYGVLRTYGTMLVLPVGGHVADCWGRKKVYFITGLSSVGIVFCYYIDTIGGLGDLAGIKWFVIAALVHAFHAPNGAAQPRAVPPFARGHVHFFSDSPYKIYRVARGCHSLDVKVMLFCQRVCQRVCQRSVSGLSTSCRSVSVDAPAARAGGLGDGHRHAPLDAARPCPAHHGYVWAGPLARGDTVIPHCHCLPFCTLSLAVSDCHALGIYMRLFQHLACVAVTFSPSDSAAPGPQVGPIIGNAIGYAVVDMHLDDFGGLWTVLVGLSAAGCNFIKADTSCVRKSGIKWSSRTAN